MKLVVVTLEVSKLSGWLNADAYCRVERSACHAGRGVEARRREGVGGASAWHARGGPNRSTTEGARARAERTANMPFMSMTLDVSKLSGWLNADADCRVEKRRHAQRDEV